MARITKPQTYAALWLRDQGKTNEEIAEELSITTKQVAGVISKYPQNTQTKQDVAISRTSKDFMIRKTSAKENNTVAIMTKEASEMNDEAKKNNLSRVKNNTSNIHRIS